MACLVYGLASALITLASHLTTQELGHGNEVTISTGRMFVALSWIAVATMLTATFTGTLSALVTFQSIHNWGVDWFLNYPLLRSSAFSGNGSFSQVICILYVRLPSRLSIASPDISLAIDVQIDFSSAPGEVAEHASKALGL